MQDCMANVGHVYADPRQRGQVGAKHVPRSLIEASNRNDHVKYVGAWRWELANESSATNKRRQGGGGRNSAICPPEQLPLQQT